MADRCTICGEPMPPGEEMFNFHGYSGNCPKPPLRPTAAERDALRAEHQRLKDAVVGALRIWMNPEENGDSGLLGAFTALAAFEAEHPEVRG